MITGQPFLIDPEGIDPPLWVLPVCIRWQEANLEKGDIPGVRIVVA